MARKNNMNIYTPLASRNCFTREQINQKISEVAYNLYEKRNYVPGNDMTDWFEAESIVKKDVQAVCDK